MADSQHSNDRAHQREIERRYRERNREAIRLRAAAYKQSPEGKAKQAAYDAKPAVIARRAANYQKSDKTKRIIYRESPWGRFIMQRANACQRGIAFLLSFEEWLSIWRASGHFENRGRGAGRYVMCRHGDEGPYAAGNVYIGTAAHNTSESNRIRSRRRNNG